MLRKTLIALGAVIALLTLAMFAVAAMSGEQPAPKAQSKTQTAPQQTRSAWEGAGDQTLDLTAQRGTSVITLPKISYAKLNTRAARVQIQLGVSGSTPGTKPGWLKPSAFRLSSDDLRVWDPKRADIVFDGEQYVVTLDYRNVPTKRLAAGYAANKSSALGLSVYSPTGRYRILLLPAAPDPGHKWGEDAGAKGNPGRAFTAYEIAQDRYAAELSAGDTYGADRARRQLNKLQPPKSPASKAGKAKKASKAGKAKKVGKAKKGAAR